MTHKLIKHDNYLLVVDDSEIEENDYFINIAQNEIYKHNIINYNVSKEYLKKITAHLPLNSSPVLEGVDLLPALEDDVEELAIIKYPIIMSPNGRTLAGGHYDVDLNYSERHAYKNGYNKAREKYKYTLSDIEAAVAFGMSLERFKDDEHKLSDAAEFNGFIQSFHQYPTEFECETESYHYVSGGLVSQDIIGDSGLTHHVGKTIKTTTINGRRTWVGKYK